MSHIHVHSDVSMGERGRGNANPQNLVRSGRPCICPPDFLDNVLIFRLHNGLDTSETQQIAQQYLSKLTCDD